MVRKKIFSLAVAGAVAFAGIFYCYESNRRSAVSRIKIGDTKAQVQAVLGKPAEIMLPQKNQGFPFLGVHCETWAYGGPFELKHSLSRHFPWFFPFKLRIFGPADNDLAIEFDSEGKVSGITLPHH
jgi:hypothetical protein